MKKTIGIKPSPSGDINEFRITGPGAANNPFESERILRHLQNLLRNHPLHLEEEEQLKPGHVMIFEVDSDRKEQVTEEQKDRLVGLRSVHFDPIRKEWMTFDINQLEEVTGKSYL